MFIVEDYMLKDLSLKGTDLMLFAFLTTKGVCEDSLTTLMKEVGVSTVNTIRSSLKSLEEKGLITINNRGNRPSVIEVVYSTTQNIGVVEEKFNPRRALFKRMGKEDLL